MKEEREKLEKLEQERIKRMQGAYVDENNKIIEGVDDLDENFVCVVEGRFDSVEIGGGHSRRRK